MFTKIKNFFRRAAAKIVRGIRATFLTGAYLVFNTPRFIRQATYATIDIFRPYTTVEIMANREKDFLQTMSWRRARTQIRIYLIDSAFRLFFRALGRIIVAVVRHLVNGSTRGSSAYTVY